MFRGGQNLLDNILSCLKPPLSNKVYILIELCSADLEVTSNSWKWTNLSISLLISGWWQFDYCRIKCLRMYRIYWEIYVWLTVGSIANHRFCCKKNHISGKGDETSEIFCRDGLDPSYFHTMIAFGHISISFMSQFVQMSKKLAFGLVRIFGTSTNRGQPWKSLHWNFRSTFLGDFLYMWTGQGKSFGPKSQC